MTLHRHFCIVWIDHREARVFHISPTDVAKLVLKPDHPTKHIHHKANSIGSGHAGPDPQFLHAVTEAIADSGAVLITGPAATKTQLVKHIHEHDPKLMAIIAAVETVDHPSDGKLVAYAKKYFDASEPRA